MRHVLVKNGVVTNVIIVQDDVITREEFTAWQSAANQITLENARRRENWQAELARVPVENAKLNSAWRLEVLAAFAENARRKTAWDAEIAALETGVAAPAEPEYLPTPAEPEYLPTPAEPEYLPTPDPLKGYRVPDGFQLVRSDDAEIGWTFDGSTFQPDKPLMMPSPVRALRTYMSDIWRRATAEESDKIEEFISQLSARERNLLNASQYLAHDDPDFPRIVAAMTHMFGQERASALLAASEF